MRSRDLHELKRIFDGLQQAGYRQYKVHLGYLHAFLSKNPAFNSVFEALQASTSGFDAEVWMTQKVFAAKHTCHEWPESEDQKLCVLLRIMHVSATHPECDPVAVGRIFTYGTNMNEWANGFTTHIVFPLVDYLQARLGTSSEILYRLARLRRQIEWFEQERLYAEFRLNTARGEQVYDRRVREFLFAEGIDYPFSQPASASGKADVVAGLDGDDPLVCEIKLYDGDSYGLPYLRQGVGQVVRYAHDYLKTSAFLVVFNLSDERLQLPSDAPTEDGLPRLQSEGVTVFMTVVQAKPMPSASKDRGRAVRTVEREQLLVSTG